MKKRDIYDAITGVDRETGVASDYANAWTTLLFMIGCPDLCLDLLTTEFRIKTYEEFILVRGYPGTYDKEVLNASDPGRASLINDAVAEMNGRLPEIFTNQTYQEITDFWEQRVRALIYEPTK